MGLNQNNIRFIVQGLLDEKTRWDFLLQLKCHSISPDLLITYLKHPEWIIRWAMADKCGVLKCEEAIDSLIHCLLDPDFLVQKSAQKALLRIGNPAIHALSLYLLNIHYKPAVMTCLMMLNKRHISVIKAIILDSKSWIIVNALLFILWHIDRMNCETHFIQFLSKKHCQKNIIMLLGELKSTAAIPYFIKLYKVFELRSIIRKAILKIGEERAFYLIVKALNNVSLSVLAKEIILKIKTPFLPYLLHALTQYNQDQLILLDIIQKIEPEKHCSHIKKLAQKDPVLYDQIQRKFKQGKNLSPFWKKIT